MGMGNYLYFSNQTITLNFYSHPDKNGTLRESIQAFEAKNTKIKINLIELPDNTNEKFEIIRTQLAKKDGSIDVIDSDVTWPAIFVASKWIEPLDKYFSETELSEHFESSIEAAKINGKLYGIPYRYDSGLIFYRKDLLEKYGFNPPESFDELLAIAKTITANEKNLYGYAGSWKNFEGLTCNYIEFLWASGGDIHIDKTGSIQFDQKEGYTALKTMSDLLYKHKIAPLDAINYSSGDLRTSFADGNLLFMRDWPAGWAVVNAENSKVHSLVGAMPIPKLHEKATSSGAYGGWQYMIAKDSKHKSAAVKFLKFMSSAEEQKRSFLNYSYLPSKRQLYYDPEILNKIPFAIDLGTYFNMAKPRPRVKNYDEITLILQSEVHKALKGDQSIEETIVTINDLLLKLNDK
jgi:multiple sugar transport system substrate-binding protein